MCALQAGEKAREQPRRVMRLPVGRVERPAPVDTLPGGVALTPSARSQRARVRAVQFKNFCRADS